MSTILMMSMMRMILIYNLKVDKKCITVEKSERLLIIYN